MSLTSDEILLIAAVLQHYHYINFQAITDYNKVIANREEITAGIWLYPAPCQNIYLDDSFYAVEYEEQHIIEDEVYYDFNDDTSNVETAGTYTYINRLEWQRANIWED